MGVGRAKGENRIIEAVRQAVSSPLLETTIEGANGVIINITGGKDLTLGQVYESAKIVQNIISDSANIIFGANINEDLSEEVIVTLIATGFNKNDTAEKPAEPRFTRINQQQQANVNPVMQPRHDNDDEQVVGGKITEEQDEPTPTTLRERESEQAPSIERKVENSPFVNDEFDYEEQIQEQEHDKRELPAFVKKLFGKK